MSPHQKAHYILENNTIMVVATASSSGKPWISPVFFSYDDDYMFYWVSDKSARHSENVRNCSDVGIVIQGLLPPKGDIEAVYIDAKAIELENPVDINHGIAVLAKRSQHLKFVTKSIADVTGNACWRMYRAAPEEITKIDFDFDKATGQAMTIRKPVEL